MRSDLDELLKEFETGRFVRPDWTKPNPVALARAVAAPGGYSPWGENTLVDEIGRRIGEPEHMVLIIADGFGMNFVNMLPEDSFSRTHLAWEHPTVVPSSTGPGMTSLYTGNYPATHGFVGWWVYLPQIGERATVYKWVQDSNKRSLDALGITPPDVFLSEPFLGKLNIDSVLYIPNAIEDSVPTLYSAAGGAAVEGFENIDDGLCKVAKRVRTARSKSLTVLYWDFVDFNAHSFGVGGQETVDAVNGLDAALGELTDALRGKARIIVTADHGHLDVPKYVQLGREQSLTNLMKCTQSGDDRTNYFHVVDGQHERFAEEFRSEFAEDFLLLTTEELVETRLLGPSPPTAAVLERLGDFTSISRNGAAFTWRGPDNLASAHRSTHGGFSPDEMMVPVLLA